MKNSYFRFEIKPGGIAELVLDNQDEKLNILSTPLMLEFEKLLEEISGNKDIKILIFKSGKRDNFIAGADIHEIESIRDEYEAMEKSLKGQEIMNWIEKLPFPTVSVIDGACLGGGLELAMACTYRIVSDNPRTQLGLPEVTLGIMPGFGGSKRLPALTGLVRGLPMVLSGKSVDGLKSYQYKLADAYYPSAFLEDETAKFVRKVLTPEGKAAILKRRKDKKLTIKLLENNPLGRALVFSSARKDILRKTKGFYPAPLEALKVIKLTNARSVNYSLKKERHAFAKLAVSPVSKNLIRLFFTGESLKKAYQPRQGGSSESRVRTAAVLGAGKMGGSIAWLSSYSGIPVLMKDISWDAVGAGYSAVHENYSELIRHKKLDERQAGIKEQAVSGTLDYRGFHKPDFIIEAILEDPELKMKIYRELEEQVRPDAVIATNTSSLSVNEMASVFKHPDRFIGFHFFNPVSRMPLVEVVPGSKTSEKTLARAVEFAKQLKKTPIVVKDCHGFLVNLVLMAYLNEAMLIAEEGVPLELTDRIMKSFGMPVGPFELLDEIGISVGYKVAKILSASYPERSGQGRLFNLIGESHELSGRTTGKGFYIYSGKKKVPNPMVRKMVLSLKPENKKPDKNEIQMRLLLRMLGEAALCLEERIIDRPDYLDMAMVMGTGFPAFRGGIMRWSDKTGIDKILEMLNGFEKKFGSRFKPAGLLLKMKDTMGRFYEI
jgi:3-hydroxyacyl-CoA dehydrogenase / enoyl-CoA hydratase / 3-hydroxybutyryl-CoA epimerase